MNNIPDKIIQITSTAIPAVEGKHPNYYILTALTDTGRIYEKLDGDLWFEVSLRTKF